jgi:ferredoxin
MPTGIARQIIRIDEDKCNGCGQCVTACAEGALAIVDGKARLVKESFCDGLGACIGECPQGALTIELRDADEFDGAAVEEHLADLGRASAPPQPGRSAHAAHTPHPVAQADPAPLACGCPGAMSEPLRPRQVAQDTAAAAQAPPSMIRAEAAPQSQLGNWPVQIHLLPLQAPYYQGADLLLAADCVPFAHAGFHQNLLRGRTLAIGCAKLDDAIFYTEKLANILSANDIRSLTVAHMEVPCCFGLEHVAAQAVAKSGKQVPIETVIIGRDGAIKQLLGAPLPEGACPARSGDRAPSEA